MSEQSKRVVMSRSGDCVDLRAMFGDRYKIARDESYWVERPEFRSAEGSWLAIIPCRFGHIYPHGGRILAVHTEGRSRRTRLAALECARVYVDSDREMTALFDVDDFARVAEVVQPRRRRRLSPDQRAASIERLMVFRFQSKSIARQNGFGEPAREETSQDDPNYIRPAEVA